MSCHAYLHLRIDKLTGQVVEALVMSDGSPTLINRDTVWVKLASASGRTYQEASVLLGRIIRRDHSWVLQFMPQAVQVSAVGRYR